MGCIHKPTLSIYVIIYYIIFIWYGSFRPEIKYLYLIIVILNLSIQLYNALNVYILQICFVGSVGLEYQGDIALDSIVVTKDGCL